MQTLDMGIQARICERMRCEQEEVVDEKQTVKKVAAGPRYLFKDYRTAISRTMSTGQLGGAVQDWAGWSRNNFLI